MKEMNPLDPKFDKITKMFTVIITALTTKSVCSIK